MMKRFVSVLPVLALTVAAYATGPRSFEQYLGPHLPSSHQDGDLRGGFCGPVSITQNSSLAVVAGSVQCAGGGITTENFNARCYDLSVLLPGQALTVNCVEFGVEANNGGIHPVDVRLYADTACPPDTASLTLLGSVTVNVADATALDLVTATFASPVAVLANTRLVVEIHSADRTVAAGGDGGAFYPGSNAAAETGPSYIKAAGCGIADYATMASIGFADVHWVQRVGYDSGPGACCAANGTCTNNVDTATCLGTPGSQPLGGGTVCGAGSCPTGACCDAGGCTVITEFACDALLGRYKGDGTTCTAGQCAGACCTDAACANNIALENCSAANQLYRGDGTTCAGSPSCSGGCCNGTFCTDGVAPSLCPGRYLGDGVACAPAGAASASCAPPNIPTVSEWGLIILGALVIGAGAIAVSRRKTTA